MQTQFLDQLKHSIAKMRMKARYILLVVGITLLTCLFFIMSFRDEPPHHEDKLPSNIGNRAKVFLSEEEQNDDKGDVPAEGLSDEKQMEHGNELDKIAIDNRPHLKKDSIDKRRSLPKGKLFELTRAKAKDGNNCSPRENVTFIKAHKTGSSTVQNIFLRYGDKHNLQFVLPPAGHHLGYPSYFEKKHMLHNEKDVYNIFCHHTRFSQKIPQIMPVNTIYITIVRDPVKVFESAFIYFKMDYRLGMTNDPEALQKFLQNAQSIYDSTSNKVHMKNPMLFDMGVAIEDFNSEELVKKHIKTFHKRYRLVMVAEYFEESLILLRDLLCWTTEDVVVFKLNTRKDDSIVSLTEKAKQNIRDWNNGDVLLYEHFNRTIQKTIDEYGRSRMATEVAELREKTQELYEKCIKTDQANKEEGYFKVWQPFGVHINAFVLKEEQNGNKDCESMIMPEIQFTKDLRRKQFPNLKEIDVMRRNKGKLPLKRVP